MIPLLSSEEQDFKTHEFIETCSEDDWQRHFWSLIEQFGATNLKAVEVQSICERISDEENDTGCNGITYSTFWKRSDDLRMNL